MPHYSAVYARWCAWVLLVSVVANGAGGTTPSIGTGAPTGSTPTGAGGTPSVPIQFPKNATAQAQGIVNNMMTVLQTSCGPTNGNTALPVNLPANATPQMMQAATPVITMSTRCPSVAPPTMEMSCDSFKGSDGHYDRTKLATIYGQAQQAQYSVTCKMAQLDAIDAEVRCLQAKNEQIQRLLSQLNDVINKNVRDMKDSVDTANQFMADSMAKYVDISSKLGIDPQTGKPGDSGLYGSQKKLQALSKEAAGKVGYFKLSKKKWDLKEKSLKLAVAREQTSLASSCMKTQTNPQWRCSANDPPTNAINYAICRYKKEKTHVGGTYNSDATTDSLADNEGKSLESVINGMTADLEKNGAATGAAGTAVPQSGPVDPASAAGGEGTTGGLGDNQGGSTAVVRGRSASAADTAASGTSTGTTTGATGNPSGSTDGGTGISVQTGVQFGDVADVANKYLDVLHKFDSPALPVSTFLMAVLSNCMDQAKTQVANERQDPSSMLGSMSNEIKDGRSTLQNDITTYISSNLKGTMDDALSNLYPDNTTEFDVSQCLPSDPNKDELPKQISCLDHMKEKVDGLLNGPAGQASFQIKGNDSRWPGYAVNCVGINKCIKQLDVTRKNQAHQSALVSQAKKTAIVNFNKNLISFTNWASSGLGQKSLEIGRSLTAMGSSLASLGVPGGINVDPVVAKSEPIKPGAPGEPDPVPPPENGPPYETMADLPADIAAYIAGRSIPPVPDLSKLGTLLGPIGEARGKVGEDQAKLASIPPMDAMDSQCVAAEKQKLADDIKDATQDADNVCWDGNMCKSRGQGGDAGDGLMAIAQTMSALGNIDPAVAAQIGTGIAAKECQGAYSTSQPNCDLENAAYAKSPGDTTALIQLKSCQRDQADWKNKQLVKRSNCVAINNNVTKIISGYQRSLGSVNAQQLRPGQTR